MNKKYLVTKEIKELYGTSPSTLSQQRWGAYGLPFNFVGYEASKRNGGIFLYNIEGTGIKSMLNNRQGKQNEYKKRRSRTKTCGSI